MLVVLRGYLLTWSGWVRTYVLTCLLAWTKWVCGDVYHHETKDTAALLSGFLFLFNFVRGKKTAFSAFGESASVVEWSGWTIDSSPIPFALALAFAFPFTLALALALASAFAPALAHSRGSSTFLFLSSFPIPSLPAEARSSQQERRVWRCVCVWGCVDVCGDLEALRCTTYTQAHTHTRIHTHILGTERGSDLYIHYILTYHTIHTYIHTYLPNMPSIDTLQMWL